jgi:hypothetical protein
MNAPESHERELSPALPELRLATVFDLVSELKLRNIRFVFAGFEDTNTKRAESSWIAGRAASRRHLERLSRMIAVALRELKQQQGQNRDSA